MIEFLKKKSLMSMVVLCAVGTIAIYFFILFDDHRAFAIGNQEVLGWAWSEHVGWISFNSKNCDADGDGLSDGSPAGCPSGGTPITIYSVNLNISTGNFSGYAWSEHIGWIKFAPTTTPPGEVLAAPVRFSFVGGCGGSNNVCGWARACSAVADKITCEGMPDAGAGGWEGWIKFRNIGVPSYGVIWKPSTGEFEGWAWADMIGWISVNCSNQGVCIGSDYKIWSYAESSYYSQSSYYAQSSYYSQSSYYAQSLYLPIPREIAP